MHFRLRHFRLVLYFYRGVAPALLLVSAALLLVLLPGLLEGWATGVPPGLVLAKVLTVPAVWYLRDQLQPNQYWLYYNLGLSRRWLWLGVAVLDGLVFLVAANALVVAVR